MYVNFDNMVDLHRHNHINEINRGACINYMLMEIDH